jgi:hypothetical protein
MRTRTGVPIHGQVNGNNGVVTCAVGGVTGVREGVGVYRVYFPTNFTLRAIATTLDGVTNGATGSDSWNARSIRLLSANTSTGAFADFGHRFTAFGDWVD